MIDWSDVLLFVLSANIDSYNMCSYSNLENWILEHHKLKMMIIVAVMKMCEPYAH